MSKKITIHNGQIGVSNNFPMSEDSWIVTEEYRVLSWLTGKISWEPGKMAETKYNEMVEEIHVNIYQYKNNNIFALFVGLMNLTFDTELEYINRIKAQKNVDVRYPSNTNF